MTKKYRLYAACKVFFYYSTVKRPARIDMCQALEELYQDGVREGREEGREEGVAMIILNMLKSGMSVSDIKKYTGVGESMIVQVQKSMGTLIHKS